MPEAQGTTALELTQFPHNSPRTWAGFKEVSPDPEIAKIQNKLAGGLEAALAIRPTIRKAWASGLDVEFKATDGSPVTNIDKLVQKTLIDRFMQDSDKDEFEIWGEEDTDKPQTVGKPKYRIGIDPIDGTEGFREGAPEPSVCFGIYNNETGQYLGGVVLAPMVGTVHYGIKGVGAYVRDLETNDSKKITQLETKTGKKKIEMNNNTTSGELGNTSAFWKGLETSFRESKDLLRKIDGVQLAMAWTVEGPRDGFVSIRKADKDIAEFDGAFGVVTAAGGVIVDHVIDGSRILLVGYPEQIRYATEKVIASLQAGGIDQTKIEEFKTKAEAVYAS